MMNFGKENSPNGGKASFFFSIRFTILNVSHMLPSAIKMLVMTMLAGIKSGKLNICSSMSANCSSCCSLKLNCSNTFFVTESTFYVRLRFAVNIDVECKLQDEDDDDHRHDKADRTVRPNFVRFFLGMKGRSDDDAPEIPDNNVTGNDTIVANNIESPSATKNMTMAG